MTNKNRNKVVVPLVAIIMVASSVIWVGRASAQTDVSMPVWRRGITARGQNPKGVVGIVSAINGSMITIVGKDSASTTYTVDASNAKVRKGLLASSTNSNLVSDIQIGDTIFVRGAITGASITAATIVDGTFSGSMEEHFKAFEAKSDRASVVIGTVSALNGTSFTVASKMSHAGTSTTYTVDASTAKVMKGSATITASLSDIAIGDTVFIRGTINGTSVTATTIIDGAFKEKGKGGKHNR